MNNLALVNRAKREAGIPGGNLVSINAAVGDSLRVVGWVDDAWRDVQQLQSQFGWRWMRATALGDVSAASMSYTIDALLGVTAGTTRFARWKPETQQYKVTAYLASQPQNEWPLHWLPYDLFRARFLVGQSMAGAPQFWSQAPDGSMLIGPTLDQAYKLRADYFKSAQSLTADTDTPDCPSEFHMIVCWRAIAEYGAYDAAPEVVSRAAANYDSMLSSLIANQGEQLSFACTPLA